MGDVDCSGSNLVMTYAETVIFPESGYLGVLTRTRQREWQTPPRCQITILAFSDICLLD